MRREGRRSTQGTTAALYKCGGIERGWTTGDNVNLAVGQGDLQATPLQVAVAYSALANNGTIVTPHLGKAIEDGNGVTLQELPHQAASARSRSTRATARSCSTACAAPPARRSGTSADVFKGLPIGVHGLRQDRHRGAPARTPTSRGTPASSRTSGKPIVVVVTVERGGFGAETAAPAARLILSQWFDVGRPRVPRRLGPEQLSASRSNPLPSRRPRWCRGNGACAWTRCCCWRRSGWSPARWSRCKGATADDMPATRCTTSSARRIYAVVGLVLMYGVSRLDYSRLRELRYPIYGVLMVSIIGVLAARAGDARRAAAGSSCRASTCSPPSSARCCWSSRWPGFVVERMREMGRQTTARVMLLGLLPTMIVMAEPDLGSATVYVVGTLAILFVAGRAVAALRRADRAVRGQRHVRRSSAAPRLGVEVLKPYQVDRLTAFLHPSADPGDDRLPAGAGADRDRLGREDRPRRRRTPPRRRSGSCPSTTPTSSTP